MDDHKLRITVEYDPRTGETKIDISKMELQLATGINVTLGLPILKTSVDHGTAFDIAGKGIAREQSMIESMLVAADFLKGTNQ